MHNRDDVAEMVAAALAQAGALGPRAFRTGEGAPEGAPFVLIRPEGGDQVWALRIDGPWDASTTEGIVAASVDLGFATADDDDDDAEAEAYWAEPLNMGALEEGSASTPRW